MNQFEYKGYKGSIEVCLGDDLLHGKLLGTNDLITYEGYTVQEIRKAFEDAVNDYLETCKELGRRPQ